MTIQKRLDAIHATMMNAYFLSDDPRLTSELEKAIRDMDVLRCELDHDEEERAAVTDALIEHVESKPLPVIPRTDWGKEAQQTLMTMNMVARIGMGVIS